jgi:hypothetical protein
MDITYLDSPLRERWSNLSACHSGEVFNFLLRKNFIPTSSVIIRTDIYYKYGPMDLSLTIAHDWDLWLKIAFENPIVFTDGPLGRLLMHKDSVIWKVHKRRRESRRIIRRWLPYVDGMWYRKVVLYYYLMEIFDILPEEWQCRLRRWWYSREKYQR